MSILFFLYLILSCAPAVSSTFDPGPPPLSENFEISDEIFEGEVESIVESEGGRGDAIAAIRVVESWKGSARPGGVTRLSFNRDCPRYVRTSDCVRHTLPTLAQEDRYVFFAKNGFTSRSYGTSPANVYLPMMKLLKAGFTYSQAEVFKGYLKLGAVVFQGVPAAIEPATGNMAGFHFDILVRKSFSDLVTDGELLKYRHWSHPLELGKAYFFVFQTKERNKVDWLRKVFDEKEIESKAQKIEEYSRTYSGRKSIRRTSVEAGGYIPGVGKYVDALGSMFNMLANAEFNVGFRWNPDDGFDP